MPSPALVPAPPKRGGSIMIWKAFSALGKAEIEFVETTRNAQKNCDVLDLSSIPFGKPYRKETNTFSKSKRLCT